MEFEKKIYNGVIRIPRPLASSLGNRVKIVSDHCLCVIYRADMPKNMVVRSLTYLTDILAYGRGGRRK